MTTEVINTILINLLPFTIALSIWFYQIIICRLPEKQRQALNYFAHLAVLSTEQKIGEALGNEKKDLAIKLIKDLFRAFNLPVPRDVLIDAALEAAVYEINLACGKAANQYHDPDPFTPQTRHTRANRVF